MNRMSVEKAKVTEGFETTLGKYYLHVVWRGLEFSIWEDGELSTPRNIVIQKDE